MDNNTTIQNRKSPILKGFFAKLSSLIVNANAKLSDKVADNFNISADLLDNRKFHILWFVFFSLGLIAFLWRFISGKDVANYNGYIPWGLWVAVYIYFVGMSAGAFFVSAVILIAKIERLHSVARMAIIIAIITLVGGLVTIFVDLGQPFRAWRVLIFPNFSSMMAWMIWLYTLYGCLLLAMIAIAYREELAALGKRFAYIGRALEWLMRDSADVSADVREKYSNRLRYLAMFGIPLAISFNGGVGALFGVIGSRPFWHSSLIPLLFLVSALASGTALVAGLYAFFWRNRNSEQYQKNLQSLSSIALGLVLLYLLFEFAEFSINLYAAIPAHAEAYKMILFGQFWWVFWIVHLFFGIALPVFLLIPPRNRANSAITGFACALIVLCFLAVRLNIVMPGLALPEIEGLEHSYTDERLNFHYFPGIWEWGITIFSYSVVMFLFYIAQRNLGFLETKNEK